MSGPKIQRQPWIDYLADAMVKEIDPNVNMYAPAVKSIIESVKTGKAEKSSALSVLRGLKTHIMLEARNKSRTENLMDGIIQFTEKIV